MDVVEPSPRRSAASDFETVCVAVALRGQAIGSTATLEASGSVIQSYTGPSRGNRDPRAQEFLWYRCSARRAEGDGQRSKDSR